MNALEIIYENKIQFPLFLERKYKITNPFTIIKGPKLSGKTYLIYDYLQSNKDNDYLYIDMSDLKDLQLDYSKLQKYINTMNIKILVIENFDYSFNLPKVDSIIISTSIYMSIDNYELLNVMPLDFEEYLAFDTKHQNTTNSFNSFLKYGNIAEIIDYKDVKKAKRNKEVVQLVNANTTSNKILELLIKNSGQIKSAFWLFTVLKKTNKISKDFFYKQIKEYELNNTIMFCPKYNSPKSTKKLFCYNHAFIDTVTYNKNFSFVFSNIIYLELFTKYENIYYDDGIDFYIEDEKTIILSIPFYNSMLLSNITAKILKSIEHLPCTNIYIVTISNQDSIFLNDIPCEIIPFYEWALIS